MMNHQYRIQRLRSELEKKNLDAFITGHLPNVRYLTGFSGSHGLSIVTGSKSFFLTDFRYKEQVRTQVTADKTFIRGGNLVESDAFRTIVASSKRIGFEQRHLTVSEYFALTKAVGKKKLVAVEGMVERLRSIKDADEIKIIKRAVEITDKVFQKILGKIRPGISELDISAEISFLHKKFGAENDAFDTIVASGKRGALPHGSASLKKIQKNEFVTLDFGCIYNGYHSDMTRTVCVGRPTSKMKKVYSIVLDAQHKALEYISVSASSKKADTVARNHIAAHGFGKYFGHSLGHGVGLEIHEDLRLSQQSKEILAEGNVVTVEPGIYLPGQFGVRIEDVVLVRHKGLEILSSSPKDLILL